MTRILLAGCGKMGSAMLEGWLAQLDDGLQFMVFDPLLDDQHIACRDDRVISMTALDEQDWGDDTKPDLIVLAMKPQMLPDALSSLKAISHDDTVFLSIAAGITMQSLKDHLGEDVAIIRTMPNTPAAIGKGITAMIFDDAVSSAMADLTRSMMAVIGDVVDLDNEADMDVVTAVSGSGPAYVFLMREVLESAAITAGLKPELAAKLAAATIGGAADLMEESDQSPSQLRINVTSPNGTTQAALDVLMDEEGLYPLMTKAVIAARDRSKELGK